MKNLYLKLIHNIIFVITAFFLCGCNGFLENGVVNKYTAIEVTPGNQVINKGDNLQLIATCTLRVGTIEDCTSSVTWSSSNSLCATITSVGVVTGNNNTTEICTVTITATSGLISGSTTLMVNGQVLESFTISPDPSTISYNGIQEYTITALCNADLSPCTIPNNQLTWTSSVPSCASIPPPNSLTASGVNITPAECNTTFTVTASPTTGCIGSNCVVTALLNVMGNLVSISITPDNPTITSGATQQFSIVGTCENGPCTPEPIVTWSTGTSTCTSASINSNGLATATNTSTLACTVEIIATADPSTGCIGNACTANIILTVSGQVLQSFTISPDPATIAYNGTQTYVVNAVCTPGPCVVSNSQITWSITAPSVPNCATIDANGIAAGGGVANVPIDGCTASVNAIAQASTGCSGCAATNNPAALNVTGTLLSIAITPASPSQIAYNGTQQFTLVPTCVSGAPSCPVPNSLGWTSGTPSCATIISTGSPTTATGQNGASSNPCSTNITATVSANTGCSTCSTFVTLPVGPGPVVLQSITVTPGPYTIYQGVGGGGTTPPTGTVQYTATGHYNIGPDQNITGSVVWTSSNENYATISSGGFATAVSFSDFSPVTGTSIITATLGPVSGNAVLTVPQISSIDSNPPSITCEGSGDTIQMIGGILTWSDSTNEPSNSCSNWQSSNPGVATVNINTGLVTCVGGGTTLITASCFFPLPNSHPLPMIKNKNEIVINPKGKR